MPKQKPTGVDPVPREVIHPIQDTRRPQHSDAGKNACAHESNKGVKQTRSPRAPVDISQTRVHRVRDIKVKASDDGNPPNITGCVVLPGHKLVLVDCHNYKVKLVDTTQHTLVSQLTLDIRPWDITQTGRTQVAVTCPDKQTICFVNVSDKLKLDSKVKVKGPCHGIASIKQDLVVSYDDPVKVELISQTGQVLRTVVSEDRGEQMFGSPANIVVSPDDQLIYVSDWWRHTVTSVGLTGQVQATYKHDKLKDPYGLAVGRAGAVYVCGWWYSNLHVLTADLTQGRELLQWSDGGKLPQSVCYSEDMDMLYIGMWRNDVLKVYQIK